MREVLHFTCNQGDKHHQKKSHELHAAGIPHTVVTGGHGMPYAILKPHKATDHHNKIAYHGSMEQRDMFSRLFKQHGIEHSKASTKQREGLRATHMILTPSGEHRTHAHRIKMAYYKKHKER